jgi:hypothetical protein
LVNQIEKATDPQTGFTEGTLDATIFAAGRLWANIAAYVVSECPCLRYELHAQ